MDFVCRQEGFYMNPNKLPVNELQLEVKIINKRKKPPSEKDLQYVKDTLHKNYDITAERMPALDLYWIQKEHSYHKYQQYYFEITPDENELFMSENKLFLENLKFLLQCNFHQFWNYVIFEPQVKVILKSFIYRPVHGYEIKHLPADYLDLYNDIHSKVANIYFRLLTFRESDVHYLSEDFAIALLKSNKLITSVDIMKLFMLYSKTNSKLMTRIRDLFFNDEHNRNYTAELNRIFNYLLMVFDMLGGQICGFEQGSVMISLAVRPKPDVYDPYWIEDVCAYLLDVATTLNAFFSNCAPAVQLAIKIGLPIRLSYFYNRIYPGLYDMMQDRANLPSNWADMKRKILNQIATSRNEFVNVFHAFATGLIDEVVQTLDDTERQNGYVEQYLSLMSTALEDEFFIFDYHHAHQIDAQLQTLSDFHPQIDHMRVNYILECLSTLPTIENLKRMTMENIPEIDITPLACSFSSQSNNDIFPTEKNTYSETEILNLTKTILDTLPQLGDGFIRHCLKFYNYNTGQVISAILDDNLPPHLDRLSREFVYVPPEPEPEKPALAYRGKKPDYCDAAQLLNDKSELDEVKKFVLKVGNDTYDDEYDDRYDDVSVLRFYDKTDDSSVYKHMENKFEEYELVSDPSESSSEGDIDQESTLKPKNAFCEDPAMLRARREANKKYKEKHDCIDKLKGQKQDKVEKKNIHTSNRKNHNRKGGAQWKRNKGMIPS